MRGEPEPPIDEAVSAQDRDVVLDGLLAFNEERIGPRNEQPVALVIRDASGAVIAGLLGDTKWGWLYVDKLWVSEAARGTGLGGRLLARAEEIARERDCVGAYLKTFEHQARPFYEQRGYQLFGTHEGYPAGTRQYYLCKRFSAHPRAR
ncbi:MAG TPA: GNAT family N-acetyltransferase [Gemmatimonadaceae bacterium]